ncbi:MAG: chitin deacetylase family protein [Cyanobacteria bacterium J06649_4]
MKRISKILGFTGIAALLLYGLLSQPRWLFSLAEWVRPGAIYTVSLPTFVDSEYGPLPPEKVVALTIDDGPSSATADILETINLYEAKATFFNISGNLAGYEETVQQVVASGHELGNHLTADEPSIRMSPTEFEADLLAAEQAFLPFLPPGTAQSLRWLRPGMGFYNQSMVDIADRHGYQLVLGSNFPYDTHVHSSRFASAFILHTVQPGDIIVLHDGEKRGPRAAETLERLLPALQVKGYSVVTVSELVEKGAAR